jgi:N-acetyl-anhydromuramyl-L-alanine amidase AmpD
MRKFIIIGLIVVATAAGVAFFWLSKNSAPEPQAELVGTPQTPAEQSPPPQPELKIIDKLLPTTSYEARGDNPYSHVMLHFASNALANPEDPHDVNATYDIFAAEEVSSHYFVDRDGTVYQFVSEEHKAWHAGNGQLPDFPELKNKLNDYAIGIELAGIGTPEEMEIYGITSEIYNRIPKEDVGYTEPQYQSLKILLDDIVERHKITYDRKHIVGHDEYVPELRTDPGQLFDWTQIGLGDVAGYE